MTSTAWRQSYNQSDSEDPPLPPLPPTKRLYPTPGSPTAAFVPILTLSSPDAVSESETCGYLMCKDIGCLKCAKCMCGIKPPKQTTIVVDVMSGGRPDNTVVRVSHVYPTAKYSLGTCCKDCLCYCKVPVESCRACGFCFSMGDEASYSFLVSDISAVESHIVDNACKSPFSKMCCWCFPDIHERSVDVHVQKSAGGTGVVSMNWLGERLPTLAAGYEALADDKNAAGTLQNLIMFLRSGYYDKLYAVQPAMQALS